MKIATSELEHLREEVKNCHCIIKDLQKKREFVGLTEEEQLNVFAELIAKPRSEYEVYKAYELALKEKNK